MHPSTRPFLRTALALALLTALPAAHATNDDPALALLTTSFSSPGARAAGMGGAFIGYARDSSTVFLNPAGIPLLARPELTVEWRARNAENTYLSSQEFSQFRTNVEDSSTGDLSYATMAFPGLFGVENLGIGVFYGTLAKAEFAAASRPIPLGTGANSIPIVLSRTDVELSQRDRYGGVGLGYQISEGGLKGLGGGLAVYGAKRQVRGKSSYGNLDFRPVVDDSDIGVNVGLLYRFSDIEGLQIGANWRSRLEYELKDIVPARGPSTPPRPDDRLGKPFTGAGSVIPSSFSFGISWERDALTLAFDVVRIRYSEILEKADAPTENPNGTAGIGRIDLFAEDGTDFRFGAEYALQTTAGPVYLRGGVARLADSSVVGKEENTFASVLYTRTGAKTGVTLGLGFVNANEDWGFDLAIDRNSDRNELVFSAFYSLAGFFDREGRQ